MITRTSSGDASGISPLDFMPPVFTGPGLAGRTGRSSPTGWLVAACRACGTPAAAWVAGDWPAGDCDADWACPGLAGAVWLAAPGFALGGAGVLPAGPL